MTLPTTLNVLRPAAEGYEALLTYGTAAGEDLYLQLAPTGNAPIRRQTAQPAGQSPNTQANPEDFRPESGRIFSRAAWSSGEGLARAHRADPGPDDGARFWSSQNIRIAVPKPGDPEEFYLAADVEAISNTGTPAAPYAAIVADSHRIYWSDADTVKYSANLLAGTPTITTDAPGGGTVVGLGILSGVLYTAHAAHGIHTRTAAGVWSHWSDLAATALWCVKGRVIAAVDAALYDAGATSTSILLKTLPTGTVWTDVCDVGHLILAAASDGLVYAFADQSGSLVLQTETPLRPGEVPYSLGYADGLIFVGTGEPTTAGGKIGRLYVTEATGNRLTGTRLIREWGTTAATANHTPGLITATRDEVLIPVLDSDGKNAVWSFLLPTAGTFCRLYLGSGTAQPKVAFEMDGRLILVRAGANMLRETATFAASGWLILPYADWYSASMKAIIGLRIESPVVTAAGEQIDVYYSTNPDAILDSAHASWVLADSITYTGDTSLPDEIPLDEVTGRGVTLKIKLTRSTSTTVSPSVRTVSARAFEDLDEVLIQIPVNTSDLVERPGKTPLQIPGRGRALYAALRARESQPAQLELLRSGEKIKGRVEEVGMQQPVITRRGLSMLSALLTVRGVKV